MAKYYECAEYSPKFQLDVLGVGNNELIDPILDIGCGDGSLVKYFLTDHQRVFGIDRNQTNVKNVIDANWLNFDYGKEKWGTIISHMSFTNHFSYHYLQNDGVDISFAKTYMKILQSLIHEGTWYYVPSVPFIEDLLPEEKYTVFREYAAANVYRTKIVKN